MNSETKTTAEKQEYQTPVVTEFGSVSELTLNTGSSGNDGITTSQ